MSSSMLINSKLSNNSFEIVQSKEVRMISTRNNKSCWSTCIWQLIISLEHKRRCKIWHLWVINSTINFISCTSKMLFNWLLELCRIKISSTSNYNILPNIIFIMELFNLFCSNWINIISNTMRWLTKSMSSEAGIMNKLMSCFFRIHGRSIFMNCWLNGFNLFCLKRWVKDSISK